MSLCTFTSALKASHVIATVAMAAYIQCTMHEQMVPFTHYRSIIAAANWSAISIAINWHHLIRTQIERNTNQAMVHCRLRPRRLAHHARWTLLICLEQGADNSMIYI